MKETEAVHMTTFLEVYLQKNALRNKTQLKLNVSKVII